MKKNSPAYPSVALCLIGAASTFASFQVGAFQLGQIQSTSRLGEPLAAHINVLMSPRETLLGTTVDVLPDFEYRNDRVMQEALKSITAKLVQNQYGQHYIALSSSKELNVPAISFRLKAANGDNILIQKYSLSPPPALRSPTQATSDTRGRRRAATQELLAPPVITPGLSISGTEYGPVRAGDTLWKIASKVAGREQAGAILNQLFELNPHAFINGDINKLKQGVTLTLPSGQTATQIAAEQSVEDVTSSTAGEELSMAPALAKATEEIIPSTEAEALPAETLDISPSVFDEAVSFAETDLESTAPPVITNTAATEAKAIDWRTENPELADKLTELGSKYAALRARYSEQSTNASDSGLESQLGETPNEAKTAFEETLTANLVDESVMGSNRVTANIETADSSPESSSVDIAEEQSIFIENDLASSGAIAQPEGASARFEIPPWLLLMLGASLLVSAIGYYLYRARVASQRKADQVLRKEKDNSLKQELAKKAQHRISMEDEVERMLHEQVEVDDGDEIEKTMQLHVDELMSQQKEEFVETVEALADDSAESRIDASISHGRYGEAEDLLREVIATSPRNFSAKLRLAEVYYITEKINDFVSISQDIHEQHRPDISDEDWRRVMRMGKMIAPDQPPFSGPQSIMGDVSAG